MCPFKKGGAKKEIFLLIVGWQRFLCTNEMIEKFLSKEASTKGRLLPSLVLVDAITRR